jgi:dTDP-4-dehydrorhamnose reductase
MIALERSPEIVHFGGLERISRYEFGKLVVDVFNIRSAKLNRCRQRDIRMAAPRPLDVSLTHEKAAKMGFQPEAIKASLKRLKARADL